MSANTIQGLTCGSAVIWQAQICCRTPPPGFITLQDSFPCTRWTGIHYTDALLLGHAKNGLLHENQGLQLERQAATRGPLPRRHEPFLRTHTTRALPVLCATFAPPPWFRVEGVGKEGWRGLECLREQSMVGAPHSPLRRHAFCKKS